MTTKLVRVDINLLNRIKKIYENQAPKGTKFKDSQIINIALSHALGKIIDVKINKNKIKIKCY